MSGNGLTQELREFGPAMPLQVSRLLRKKTSAAIAKLAFHPATLFVCMFLIVAVSTYDVFCTVAYVESLEAMEVNPIGRWLLGLRHSQLQGPPNFLQLERVAFFVSLKFAGTLLVVLILQGLYQWRRSWSGPVALNVAGFQLGLFAYLVL